ncbi:hypothetical protein AHiyo6_27130, partial [Arthrobacter sp. Hiyo6]
MRSDVPQRTGTCRLLPKPPAHRGASVAQPVLQIRGADLQDRAEPAGCDKLPSVRKRGNAPVVEPDHGLHSQLSGNLCGGNHGFGLSERIRERFLGQHVLPGLERCDRDLCVQPSRGADVHDVHIVTPDDLAPVGRRLRPTIAGRSVRNLGRVPADKDALLDGGNVKVGPTLRQACECALPMNAYPIAAIPRGRLTGAPPRASPTSAPWDAPVRCDFRASLGA